MDQLGPARKLWEGVGSQSRDAEAHLLLDLVAVDRELHHERLPIHFSDELSGTHT